MTTFLVTQTHVGQPHLPQTSAENLVIPLEWLIGSSFAVLTLVFTVIWWVRGLSEKVDQTDKKLHEFIAESREDRVEFRILLKKDINASAVNICHGFELFAQEMRQKITHINDRLDARETAIGKMRVKSEHLDRELRGFVDQLRAKGIEIHSRRCDERDYDG